MHWYGLKFRTEFNKICDDIVNVYSIRLFGVTLMAYVKNSQQFPDGQT